MPDTRRRGEVGEFPPVCERTSTLQRGECECRRYDDPSSPSFPSPIPSAAPTTTALSHTHSLTLALIFWSFGLSRPFASVRVRPPTCFLRIRGFTSAAIVSLVKDDRWCIIREGPRDFLLVSFCLISIEVICSTCTMMLQMVPSLKREAAPKCENTALGAKIIEY